MFEIRSLENETLENIHACFLDAFSDYEVKTDLPIERLSEMMATRSYSPELSLGCYGDQGLVGFTLVGYRCGPNSRDCYDIATGTAKAHQRQGAAGQLLKELLKRLEAAGIDHFWLEVLENNAGARKMYEDVGFRITRKLLCYRIEHPALVVDEALPTDGLLAASINETEFSSFRPSWQSSLESYGKFPQAYLVLTLKNEASGLAGYGIVHRNSGSILQIGSAPGAGRERIVERVLGALHRALPRDSYTFLNVEEGSWMSTVLQNLGFKQFISQYEMSHSFKKPN